MPLIIALIIIFLSPSLLTAQNTTPQNTTIRFADFENNQSFFFKKIITPLQNRIKKSSRNTLSLSFSHTYSPTSDVISELENNQYDMARLSPLHTTFLYPALEAFQIPFISRDAKTTTLAMQALVQNQEKAFQTLPIIPLLTFSTGPHAFHITSQDTNFNSSLASLSVPTTNRPAAVFLQALGAKTSIPSPFSFSPNHNAFLAPLHSSVSSSLNIALHFIPPSRHALSTDPQMLIIRRSFFLNLHTSQQKAILQHSRMNLASWVGSLFKLRNQRIKALYRQQKKLQSIPTDTLKLWQDIATKVTTAWISSAQKKNLPAHDIIKSVQKLISQHSVP